MGVGAFVTLLIGAALVCARHFGLGCACCQCSMCAAFIGGAALGGGKASSDLSPNAAAALPVSPAGAIKASAFETGSFRGTSAATASPALLGGANSSSGEDSVDLMAAPAGPSSNGPPSGALLFLRFLQLDVRGNHTRASQ